MHRLMKVTMVRWRDFNAWDRVIGGGTTRGGVLGLALRNKGGEDWEDNDPGEI